LGEIASEGFKKTVGVHRSPEDFVAVALEADHPGTACNYLPVPMAEAVQFAAASSLETVGRFRSEALREMVARANALKHDEDTLKKGHVGT
jgi:hypothetical protein